MNLGIENKLALVVGASKGLGRAVAIELAAQGARVICVARDGEALDSLARELMETSRKSHYFHRIDLMPDREPKRFCDHLADNGQVPDIIYHCIGGSVDGIRAVDSSADDYAKVWRYNVGIGIEINNAFIPAMIERGWGRIVHTSSDCTKCNSGNSPYTSSKFALEGYVKTASRIYSHEGIIITAIAPGNFYTPGKFLYDAPAEKQADYFDHHLPIQRWGSNEEIAKVVAFLCSQHSSFMPGAIVRCDGGSR